MSMHNPPHPGAILREDMIKPLGLSVTSTAEALGISRKTLSRITNEGGSISPEMAVRLEMAFKKPNAEQWLRLQNAFDLWQARQNIQHLHVSAVA